MAEFLMQRSGDTERAIERMTELLSCRGWVVVNGVVRSISPGLGIYYQVDPGSVSVFSPTEEAKRWLPINPGMASNIYIQMPHVMLALHTFRYGWLNSIQIAGGTIAGINGFRLVEKD